MPISMYQASVPVFDRMLVNLAAILAKAAAWAESRKIDPQVLFNARLAPDMLPLSRQVQISCDFAKGTAARLAGLEPPKFEDKEATFPDLEERIARTRTFLNTLDSNQFAGSEERVIRLKAGQRELEFKGLDYLCSFATPNFYFHCTTAYAILRHNGLDIGKRDFVGG